MHQDWFFQKRPKTVAIHQKCVCVFLQTTKQRLYLSYILWLNRAKKKRPERSINKCWMCDDKNAFDLHIIELFYFPLLRNSFLMHLQWTRILWYSNPKPLKFFSMSIMILISTILEFSCQNDMRFSQKLLFQLVKFG